MTILNPFLALRLYSNLGFPSRVKSGKILEVALGLKASFLLPSERIEHATKRVPEWASEGNTEFYSLLQFMTISWFGLSSFKITGKDITIITDPFGKTTGLSAVRGAADVIICSNPNLDWCNNFSSISGTPFLVSGPGEYDIKEAFIIGTPADNKDLGSTTIYAIEIEGIRIAFMGPIKQSALTDEQKNVFEGADIVLVPIGGKQILDFESAAKIATQMEPFIIIPHSFKISGLELNLDKVDKFLQEMGGKHTEEEKLTLKKKELVGEQTSLVVLTPQR